MLGCYIPSPILLLYALKFLEPTRARVESELHNWQCEVNKGSRPGGPGGWSFCTDRRTKADGTLKAFHLERQEKDQQGGRRKAGRDLHPEEMARPLTNSILKRSLISVALLLFFALRKSSGGEVMVDVGCSGKLGDCLWEKEEMEMDSETNRRVLWAAQKKYISYGALKGDVVPCTKPGVPYYNCRALPKASPYSRGCQAISECRGG